MIKIESLVGGYSKAPVINGVDLHIHKGEFFALLGPNGSGKTTLFKLITGALPVQEGDVYIHERPLSSFSKLEKARQVAVLTQEAHVSFDFTVEEIVSLGRYAFQKGILKNLSKEDRAIIDEVMELTDVTRYRDKQFRTISGGEKQRVLLAKALAQQPKILLLDEPTNHLDVKHSFHMLDLLKQWQKKHELTIFAILHDLNVASLYADRVALLQDGGFARVGDVSVLKEEKLLQEVYNVKVKAQAHPDVPKTQLLMTPKGSDHTAAYDFRNSVRIRQNEGYIHIQFDKPLRTVSNSVTGDGIQWLTHFCNFHVNKNYDGSDPADDIIKWMENLDIPAEHAAGMMTAVTLSDAVFVEKSYNGVDMLVMVTAGTGNAVDISNEYLNDSLTSIGTINTMVFLNRHLTDGALVNACLSATEAKTKAVMDMGVTDPFTGTTATGTSTDSLLIGATQIGKKTVYTGSGTVVGKAIGTAVYEATAEALRNYKKKGR